MTSASKKSARASKSAAPGGFEPDTAGATFGSSPVGDVMETTSVAAVAAAATAVDAAEELEFQAEDTNMMDAQAEMANAIDSQIEQAGAMQAKLVEAPAASVSEMQERMRAAVEKSIVETRANYAKVKNAADGANSAIQASLDAAKSGAIDLHAKTIDAMKANADANFEFFKSLVTVKSMADYVALHTEFARKQLESMTAQTKEIGALAQKVATETANPIQAQVAKTFKIAV